MDWKQGGECVLPSLMTNVVRFALIPACLAARLIPYVLTHVNTRTRTSVNRSQARVITAPVSSQVDQIEQNRVKNASDYLCI